MLPTMRLRFVKRVIPIREFNEPHDHRVSVGREVTVLQQWWNKQKLTDDGFRPIEGGEWRDVPTEEA
jgi:hypothetical protein